MTMSNLKSIASYVWLGDNFCYSEVKGALESVATFWNRCVGNGSLIHYSRYYLINEHKKGDKIWNIVIVYAPNTREGRFCV